MKVYCDNELCAWCYDGECHRSDISIEAIDFGALSICMDLEEMDDEE